MKGHSDGCNALHFFNETDLPVFHFLAKNGALFDSMFSSMAGEKKRGKRGVNVFFSNSSPQVPHGLIDGERKESGFFFLLK
jgi:hypothetical protein